MSNVTRMSEDVIAKIGIAAGEQKLLQLTYVDAKGKPSIRTVEPYEVKDGKLFAYCTVKDGIRAFKLDSIQSAEVHISEYTPRFPILI